MPINQRFNANAANRVDVLHTNIDGFGLAEPCGHVDFYANGGVYSFTFLRMANYHRQV